LVIPDHALGSPVLRTLSLCTCCRHYPGTAAGRIPRSFPPSRISLPRKERTLQGCARTYAVKGAHLAPLATKGFFGKCQNQAPRAPSSAVKCRCPGWSGAARVGGEGGESPGCIRSDRCLRPRRARHRGAAAGDRAAAAPAPARPRQPVEKREPPGSP
jgi:hypothetical protein